MPSLMSGKGWERSVCTEVDRKVVCDIIVYNEEELVERKLR